MKSCPKTHMKIMRFLIFFHFDDSKVERKSISDLYQSFSRGRLYNQIEMLCRTFQTPILLIEFSENQSFCLQVIIVVERYMLKQQI